MYGVQPMHFFLQFFLLLLLLVNFLLFLSIKCCLSLKTYMTQRVVPYSIEYNRSDTSGQNWQSSAEIPRRDASIDSSDPRLAHQCPVGMHKSTQDLWVQLEQCRSNRMKHGRFVAKSRTDPFELAGTRKSKFVWQITLPRMNQHKVIVIHFINRDSINQFLLSVEQEARQESASTAVKRIRLFQYL